VLWAEDGETLEGAGCWSPLFPARMDDLLLSASSTIKVIEEVVGRHKCGTRLIVFEQIESEGFEGLKRYDTIGDLECTK